MSAGLNRRARRLACQNDRLRAQPKGNLWSWSRDANKGGNESP